MYLCFVCPSEQTAIIYLYSINLLVFITETECLLRGTDRISTYIYIYIILYIQPSKAQWLLYVPPILTLKNSPFCPCSAFVCFVWISEQTAITSLYNNDWFFLIRDKKFTARYGLTLNTFRNSFLFLKG